MSSLRSRLEAFLHPQATAARQFYVALAVAAVAMGGLLTVFSPLKVLGAALALVVVVAALWRPQVALFFLALYVPFEPFLLKFVPDDLYVFARYFSEVLIYVLVAATIYRVIVSRTKKAVATPLDTPFILFCIVAIGSALINLVPAVTAVLGLRQIIRFILLFFIVAYLEPSKKYIKALTAAMLAVMLVQSGIGIVQNLSGGAYDDFFAPNERRYFEGLQLTTGTIQVWDPGTRVFGTMGRYDQLGTFMCFFLLVVVGLLYTVKDERYRKALWATLAIAAPAFVMTHSRSGWFGFALGVLLIGGVLMKDWRVRIGLALSVVFVVLYVFFTGIAVRYVVDLPDQNLAERLLEVFSYERWSGEYYGLGRLFWIIQTPLVVVPSAPIFGVGPGQFGGGAAAALGNSTVYDELGLPFGVYGDEGFIDNNWFSLWGETGTLGLIFFLWMFAAMFYMAWRVFRTSEDEFTRGLALGFCGVLLAIAFQGALGTVFEVRTLGLYLWMFAGVVFVLGEKEKVLMK